MDETDVSDRRDFLYYATAGAGVVASGAALWPLINQMNPSADVRALATISVDISGLAEGTQLTVNWRGKPVFIRHRTQAEMAQAREEAVSTLPDTDARNPNLPGEATAQDENRAIPGHDAYCRVALKSETRRVRGYFLPLIMRFHCHRAYAFRALPGDVNNRGKQTWLLIEGAQ
jgi:ubiquinol-cytochrome c reductase iron-sulfur subunit